jgi:hypothetical protein
MDFLPEFSQPAYYELRVHSLLSKQGDSWFPGMEIVVDENTNPAQTIIKGFIVDQAALHGLISRIRDLGLILISINRIEWGEEESENGLLAED